jgi:hypothetical protein
MKRKLLDDKPSSSTKNKKIQRTDEFHCINRLCKKYKKLESENKKDDLVIFQQEVVNYMGKGIFDIVCASLDISRNANNEQIQSFIDRKKKVSKVLTNVNKNIRSTITSTTTLTNNICPDEMILKIIDYVLSIKTDSLASGALVKRRMMLDMMFVNKQFYRLIHAHDIWMLLIPYTKHGKNQYPPSLDKSTFCDIHDYRIYVLSDRAETILRRQLHSYCRENNIKDPFICPLNRSCYDCILMCNHRPEIRPFKSGWDSDVSSEDNHNDANTIKVKNHLNAVRAKYDVKREEYKRVVKKMNDLYKKFMKEYTHTNVSL